MNFDNVGVVLVDIFRNIDTNSLYKTKHGRMYSDSIELIKDAIKLSSMISNLASVLVLKKRAWWLTLLCN